ncbi:hypothetical protein V1514DRAFT_319401 [Lipomyces japonicus]|uniref:uncharacterized protein n=1 Tax=Lipomyces japonicus TaxID=56871 RepID=UPI0034CDE227
MSPTLKRFFVPAQPQQQQQQQQNGAASQPQIIGSIIHDNLPQRSTSLSSNSRPIVPYTIPPASAVAAADSSKASGLRSPFKARSVGSPPSHDDKNFKDNHHGDDYNAQNDSTDSVENVLRYYEACLAPRRRKGKWVDSPDGENTVWVPDRSSLTSAFNHDRYSNSSCCSTSSSNISNSNNRLSSSSSSLLSLVSSNKNYFSHRHRRRHRHLPGRGHQVISPTNGRRTRKVLHIQPGFVEDGKSFDITITSPTIAASPRSNQICTPTPTWPASQLPDGPFRPQSDIITIHFKKDSGPSLLSHDEPNKSLLRRCQSSPSTFAAQESIIPQITNDSNNEKDGITVANEHVSNEEEENPQQEENISDDNNDDASDDEHHDGSPVDFLDDYHAALIYTTTTINIDWHWSKINNYYGHPRNDSISSITRESISRISIGPDSRRLRILRERITSNEIMLPPSSSSPRSGKKKKTNSISSGSSSVTSWPTRKFLTNMIFGGDGRGDGSGAKSRRHSVPWQAFISKADETTSSLKRRIFR